MSSEVVRTTEPLLSLEAFHGLIWAGFAVCTVAYTIRVYIRYVCFRRLLADDYLMLLALLLLAATAATGQMVLKDIYMLMAVGNGEMMPGPDFLYESKRGLLGFAIQSIFCYAGLWVVKFGFLVFFYRLGHKVRQFLILWWIALAVNIGCLAAEIGIMQFNCLFGPIETIMTTCNLPSSMAKTYDLFKVSCILDVVSDLFILIFPISILWKVRISLRNKLILGSVFCLVAFTIGVTIVRGSIFGGVYKSIDDNNYRGMNVSWIWFWFNIEFIVSFIISTLVSFRALFTQDTRKKPVPEKRDMRDGAQPTGPLGFRTRARRFQDSLVYTLRTLDGGQEMADLPNPSEDGLRLEASAGSARSGPVKSLDGRTESARSLHSAHAAP